MDIILRYGIFFIALLASSIDALAGDWENKELKIGVIAPSSGEGSELSRPMLDGIKLAAKHFNARGGVNGKKIELAVRDIKDDYSAAKNAAIELMEGKAAAILASPAGWSTFTPVNFANTSKTIFMSVGSTRHVGRSGPYIFRNTLSDEIATDGLIKYCREKLGFNRFVIVTSMVDDEYTLSIAGLYRRAVQKHGGELVAEAFTSYDLTLEEAAAKLKKDSKAAVDAAILVSGSGNALDFIKEIRKIGIKAPILGAEGLYSGDFLKGGGTDIAGTLLYTSFYPQYDRPETVSFVKAYKAEYGKAPSGMAALAYDSFMLVAESIKKVGEGKASKIRIALTGIKNYPGVTGPISMSEDGESINTPIFLKIERTGKGMEFQPIK